MNRVRSTPGRGAGWRRRRVHGQRRRRRARLRRLGTPSERQPSGSSTPPNPARSETLWLSRSASAQGRPLGGSSRWSVTAEATCAWKWAVGVSDRVRPGLEIDRGRRTVNDRGDRPGPHVADGVDDGRSPRVGPDIGADRHERRAADAQFVQYFGAASHRHDRVTTVGQNTRERCPHAVGCSGDDVNRGR